MTVWMALTATLARAQDDGPIGRTQQALVGGVPVGVEEQRERGLVTLGGGGCSGTLVNRYWVLTAAHCVNLTAPANTVTAAWSTAVVHPTRVISYQASDNLDVALLFLGEGDFGAVPTQLLYVGEVDTGMQLRFYGQGIYQLATDAAHPSLADGVYRTGVFTADPGGVRSYTMPANAEGQVGAGGDSGGPDYVVSNGVLMGIAGVHSWASITYVPGQPQTWMWVNQVESLTSAALADIRWDIVQRIHETPKGDVWVATSSGDALSDGSRWLTGFCTRQEDCQVADVDGDGREDLVRFVKTDFSTRDSDVWVARSTGSGFSAPEKWADYFCTLAETCALGDVNGDGRADAISFVKTNHGAGDSDVWVALSSGYGFARGRKVQDYFCTLDETCAVGDVDGDGRDDLITFAKTTHGSNDSDVFVSRSTRTGFLPAEKWHDFFCTLAEVCKVADVNGDGMDDLVTFVRTNHGSNDSDVFVALSNGHGFGPGTRWHDYFCTLDETCDVGDVDGDGMADLVSFVKTNHGVGDSDVWVARSNGVDGFGPGERWADYFCTLDETCAVGDVNGDGSDDGIAFVRGQ